MDMGHWFNMNGQSFLGKGQKKSNISINNSSINIQKNIKKIEL